MNLKKCKITIESVFLYIMISCLCSCSSTGQIGRNTLNPSWDGRKKQISDWAASEKAKVDDGTLKRSEYWKQFYRKSIEERPDLDDFLYFASEMIKVSRIFEEGKITNEQFEDKQRQLTALLAKEENRRAEKLSLYRMSIEENKDLERFVCYRESLFLDYVNNLRRELNAAGPNFSVSHCAFFGGSIQCTSQNPPF